jgi:hypothetical protein
MSSKLVIVLEEQLVATDTQKACEMVLPLAA